MKKIFNELIIKDPTVINNMSKLFNPIHDHFLYDENYETAFWKYKHSGHVSNIIYFNFYDVRKDF